MPLDINMLRTEGEGGMTDRVLDSQCLRSPHVQREKIQEFLSEVRLLECDLRESSNSIDLERYYLRQLQKSLAPNVNTQPILNKDKAMEKIKQHKEIIRFESKKISERGKNLRYKVFQIGNLVDAEVTSFQNLHEKEASSTLDVQLCTDPVFCLGGYEKIQVEGSLTFTSTMGIFEELRQAFISYAISKLKKANYTLIECPNCIEVSKEIGLSALGCGFKKDSSRDEETTAYTLPSFATALMLQKGKVYFDKELPQGQLYLSMNQQLLDSREEQRISSLKHTKRKWYKEMKTQQIGLLGLTVCTLEESRRVQIEMVDQILELYSTLLVDEKQRDVTHPRNLSMVRKRSALPCELEPFEASRIVIEGFLLGEFITLGFVSNCTDYISRAFDIRCGGANVEFVHSIHATIGGVNETLEWLVQNNVVKENKISGVLIPFDLATSMDNESEVFVPFRRCIKRGSRKTIIEELQRAPPAIICNKKSKSCLSYCNNREPSKAEINGERLMSRVNFLPFHC